MSDDFHPADQRRGHRDAWRLRYRADNYACLRSTLAGHRLGCADLRGYDRLSPLSSHRLKDQAKSAQAVLITIKPQGQAGQTVT